MSMTAPGGLLTGQKQGLLTSGQPQSNPDLEFLNSPQAPQVVTLVSPQGEQVQVKKEEAGPLIMQGWKLVKAEQTEAPSNEK